MEIRSFTFDDINSLDYGVYITGSGVYDAPERDVDVISIPGRNGDFYLDNGRFNNIDVTYPASMGRMSQNDFSEKMQEFRNALLSKTGYCRLYDSYNPDEFRLGVYKSGLNVSPNKQNRAGEFDITFNCKPQRYLKSGEQSVTVESGDTVVNPTPFDANPIVIVTANGQGAVYVNERPIILKPQTYGDLSLNNTHPTSEAGAMSGGSWSDSASTTWTDDLYHTGDSVRAGADIQLRFEVDYPGIDDFNFAFGNNCTNTNTTIDRTNQRITFIIVIPKNILRFTTGTSKQVAFDFSVRVLYETDPASGVIEDAVSFNGTVSYNGAKTITVSASGTAPNDSIGVTYYLDIVPTFIVNSSISIFDNDIYFDSESCDAYTYDDSGTRISLNSQVTADAGFPVLRPGINGVSFFGGVQTCKIMPRWWIV